jgi:hypothetical protein
MSNKKTSISQITAKAAMNIPMVSNIAVLSPISISHDSLASLCFLQGKHAPKESLFAQTPGLPKFHYGCLFNITQVLSKRTWSPL